MSGFRVAGKTATAQKVDTATGKMSTEKFTASFMGFVPADRPRLAIVVVLDEPMIGRYGGDLAGPVFRRVAEASLRYLGVTPPAGPATKVTKVTRANDPADLTMAALHPAHDKNDALPANQPGCDDAHPCEVGRVVPPGSVKVPDATSMGARDAVRVITQAGLVPQIEGSGRLVRQNPAAGAAVPRGSSVRLMFEPAS
jgi:cell division protein FtsI (penicillin-binding protein 3)